jgi:hypothetical protein
MKGAAQTNEGRAARTVLQRVRRPIVSDGRSMVNASDLRDDGWTVIEVGRAAS